MPCRDRPDQDRPHLYVLVVEIIIDLSLHTTLFSWPSLQSHTRALTHSVAGSSFVGPTELEARIDTQGLPPRFCVGILAILMFSALLHLQKVLPNSLTSTLDDAPINPPRCLNTCRVTVNHIFKLAAYLRPRTLASRHTLSFDTSTLYR